MLFRILIFVSIFIGIEMVYQPVNRFLLGPVQKIPQISKALAVAKCDIKTSFGLEDRMSCNEIHARMK